MNHDSHIQHAVDVLTGKYRCHTVILYGSRARGDFGQKSDYDIMGLTDGREDTWRDAHFWQGSYMDLFIHPTKKFDQVGPSMLYLLGGRVLVEREQIGTQLLSAITALYKKGPQGLRADDAQVRIAWAQKTLERAREDDLEAHSAFAEALLHPGDLEALRSVVEKVADV